MSRRDAPSVRAYVALIGICLGFFAVLLDATIVNVSLPAIGTSLGGSLADLQWIVNVYTLTFAAFMLNAGVLGDRQGARRTYLLGLMIFTAATALCAGAPSAALLLAARAAQGIGAAAIVPCSLALIAHRFPEGPARARALGAWGAISGVGLAAGPVLGGALIDSLGWRWVFLAAIPVTVASAVMVAATVGETPRIIRGRTDLCGQVLAVLALAAIAAAFTTPSTDGWGSPRVPVLAALGCALVAAFALAERTTSAPMLPLEIFANRRFAIATLIGALFNFGLYGSLFCLALYVEHTQHRSAREAGLAIVPLAVVVVCCTTLSGRVSNRLGPRPPLIQGLLAGAVGAGLLAQCDQETALGTLMVCTAIFGGIGLAMPAMTAVCLDASPMGKAGLGAAVLNVARQIGGLLGVAVLGGVLGARGALPSLRTPLMIVVTCYLIAVWLATRLPATPSIRTPTSSGRETVRKTVMSR